MIPYLGDWFIHHPDRKVLLRHQAQLMNMLDLVGFVLNGKKSELDLTQDIQFLRIRLRLYLGEASLPESKPWEIVARARHLSSLHVLTYAQVSQLMGSLNWATGLIPLGCLYLRPLQRHFHSLGLTDRFTQLRPSGPCQVSTGLAGPRFSYLRNPSHYKTAGFSDEVSRLAAAPRRPSTNHMYDERWLHFARWAAGQGFDPLDPTATQIASFLFDLFDTHGLSPQTIKGAGPA